jgi:mono/diheme cytochrome c family protein
MKSFATHLAFAAALIAIFAATAPGAAQDTSQPSTRSFSGATLYDSYCATCHGARATGDGPLATMLRKPPANLTLLAQRNGGVFSAEMVSKIVDGRNPLAGHGGGDMPIWGEAFDKSSDGADMTSAKIAALVEYLKSIQQKPAS